uniref:Uncharacterized protein n=1 Tax=Tanacetum cinerariifolium TaxID=118510 RepID=A0A699IBU5_TANCI|nr:hypothetical protein [Tanacetum cinerariifolium]
MFTDLDQALDKLDQVIKAQDVSNLFVIYDQPINDEGGVVPFEGILAVVDANVIPNEVYAAMIAHDMLEDDDDGDVISTDVFDAMVAQEMLKDQTRAIKRRRVMADKADEDDSE